MRSTGIRELKNRLSYYMRLVDKGETILVTDRGQVVAQLSPPPEFPVPGVDTETLALERLARAGHLRRARGTPPSAHLPLLPAVESADLQQIFDELRSDN